MKFTDFLMPPDSTPAEIPHLHSIPQQQQPYTYYNKVICISISVIIIQSLYSFVSFLIFGDKIFFLPFFI